MTLRPYYSIHLHSRGTYHVYISEILYHDARAAWSAASASAPRPFSLCNASAAALVRQAVSSCTCLGSLGRHVLSRVHRV